MARRPPFARIATTLPAETLREADDLAAMGGVLGAPAEPRVFSSYDDFMARRHQSGAT